MTFYIPPVAFGFILCMLSEIVLFIAASIMGNLLKRRAKGQAVGEDAKNK